jgi:hypothetical protein
MRKFVMVAALSATLLTVQGCSSTSIPNPFEPAPPANVNEVYFGEFRDVPVPSDMSEQTKYTAVSQNADGSKSGTQVFEGRIDRQSLVNAMIHNMTRQGWALRSVFRGQRSVLLFEKADRNAIIGITDGQAYSTMEVWVTQRLADGAGVSSGAGTASEGTYPTGNFSVAPNAPVPSGSGGGVKEQGLSQ